MKGGCVPPRATVFQLCGRGFCSELDVMLLALHFTRSTGGRFIPSSRYWNAAVPRGWRDYLEPFAEEWNSPLLRKSILAASPNRSNRLLRLL